VGQDQLRKGRDEADRREVLVGVEGDLLVDQRIDGMSHCHQVQGVSVTGRFGHQIGGNDAVGADLVLADDRLSPDLCQLLPDRAGQQIRGPAGREGNDHADRFRRVLGAGGDRRRGNDDRCHYPGQAPRERGSREVLHGLVSSWR
jgi:hypothetical protein